MTSISLQIAAKQKSRSQRIKDFAAKLAEKQEKSAQPLIFPESIENINSQIGKNSPDFKRKLGFFRESDNKNARISNKPGILLNEFVKTSTFYESMEKSSPKLEKSIDFNVKDKLYPELLTNSPNNSKKKAKFLGIYSSEIRKNQKNTGHGRNITEFYSTIKDDSQGVREFDIPFLKKNVGNVVKKEEHEEKRLFFKNIYRKNRQKISENGKMLSNYLNKISCSASFLSLNDEKLGNFKEKLKLFRKIVGSNVKKLI